MANTGIIGDCYALVKPDVWWWRKQCARVHRLVRLLPGLGTGWSSFRVRRIKILSFFFLQQRLNEQKSSRGGHQSSKGGPPNREGQQRRSSEQGGAEEEVLRAGRGSRGAGRRPGWGMASLRRRGFTRVSSTPPRPPHLQRPASPQQPLLW